MYQKEIEVGERINLYSSSVTTIDINSESSITVAEEDVTKYDSSSDEEIFEAKDLLEECTSRESVDLPRCRFSSRGDISIWSTSTV